MGMIWITGAVGGGEQLISPGRFNLFPVQMVLLFNSMVLRVPRTGLCHYYWLSFGSPIPLASLPESVTDLSEADIS